MILPNIKEAVLVISVVLLTQTFYLSINIDTDMYQAITETAIDKYKPQM